MVGGVLSHNPALATLAQLPGPLVFHIVCMLLAMACLAKAGAARRAAESARTIERV